MRHFARVLTTAILSIAIPAAAFGQDSTQQDSDTFASENAVLDTSILFSIGAREARQQLRGAFGWPTFQEGLVEGVYFRFDPDGYARFAPTPRLDTDVFEVICRPRTTICMGRKDGMQVTLNSRGQIQLEFSDLIDSDQFVLSDGISELPLPPAIRQPLDPRMELLLAAGGDISVRRNMAEVQRISLAGFGAVAPYLRWVAAKQDYTVLPRGWPVPNSGAVTDNTRLTQASVWQSPMPQPHVVTQMASVQDIGSANAPTDTDVAEVRGELNVLREMLLGQQAAVPTQAPAQLPALPTQPVQSETNDMLVARIDELMKITASLQEELHHLKTSNHAMAAKAAPTPVERDMVVEPTKPTRDVARHLEYLMTEVGLTPDVALMVVQQAQLSGQTSTEVAEQAHDQVVDDILQELRAQLPTLTESSDEANNRQVSPPVDYQLLSDYFRSVAPSE